MLCSVWVSASLVALLVAHEGSVGSVSVVSAMLAYSSTSSVKVLVLVSVK